MRINKYEDLGCKEDVRQLLNLHMEMKKHFILQNEIQKVRGKTIVVQEFDQKLRIAERLLDKVIALRNHIRQNGPSMPMDIDLSQTRRTNETTSSPKESSSGNFTKTPLASSDTGEASFNVYLTGMSNRIATIKAIREFLNCGLKEAMDFADGSLPVCILENADGERSNDFKVKLEAIGAGVNICAVGSAEDRMIHKGIYMPSANSKKEQTSQANINTTNATSSKGSLVMVVAIAIILLLIFFHKFIIGFILVAVFPIALFVAFIWWSWLVIKKTW